jgi:hypothetical protein
MRFRDDYLPALRACLQQADDWFAVEQCFQPSITVDEVDDGRPVVYAFGYMLVEPSREEVRDRSGVFAPRIEWNGAGIELFGSRASLPALASPFGLRHRPRVRRASDAKVRASDTNSGASALPFRFHPPRGTYGGGVPRQQKAPH